MLISLWPLLQWGMDILDPFASAPEHLKYLIIVVDYFTKWTEVEALANITAVSVFKFFKRNVIAKFEVPQAL